MSYQGSELFKPLSDSIGLPLDQLNFLLSQVFSIVAGSLFRVVLKPCPKNTLARHIVGIVLGMVLGHFCYGRQMWHLFFQSFVTYLALLFCPRRYVHLFTFVFAMGYLSAMHIYRLVYDYGNYTLDISGQMMISTQKLTSLAFAFYDGMRAFEDLNDDQKSQCVKECPHVIEFLSYIFNFQGVIVGPLVYYRDYIDYINGNNLIKNQKGAGDQYVSKIRQPNPIVMPEILEKGILFRFFYYYVSASSQRVKYYLAWTLADATNNASGLGFNGYDQNGNAKWDLITNVNILALETSTSMKTIFDNWNIQTQLWFRRIAYDRLSTGKTLGVFVLSAFWHGFYPGYYMTFILCAFLVYSGRGIRRRIRPYFQKNKYTKIFYAIITWTGTIFSVNYSAASFDLLELKKSIQFYNTWYWFLHILVILIVVALPGGSTKPKKKTQEEDKKPAVDFQKKD